MTESGTIRISEFEAAQLRVRIASHEEQIARWERGIDDLQYSDMIGAARQMDELRREIERYRKEIAEMRWVLEWGVQ